MTEETSRIATHEAGHAVVAQLLCMNPEYVTIEPTEAALGHLARRRICVMPYDTWRDLLVLCAGLVAEGLMDDDMLGAHDELTWDMPENGASDSVALWNALRAHSDDVDQQQEWFGLAFDQTEQILSDAGAWRAVKSLAERLMEKRTIDRDEAAEVIEAALGDSEWERDQFGMGMRHAAAPSTWLESREEYRELQASLAGVAK